MNKLILYRQTEQGEIEELETIENIENFQIRQLENGKRHLTWDGGERIDYEDGAKIISDESEDLITIHEDELNNI